MKQFMSALGLWLGSLLSAPLFAQSPDSSALYRTLKANDSLIFERGFNQCDLQQFDKLVADDFEFYHDKGGITRGKAAFIESIRTNICNQGHKPVRILTPGSLQVFPLMDNGILYGAIQTGLHSFRDSQDGQPEKATSQARFTHLWLLQQGQWKLARGLSYDHLPANGAPDFDNDNAIAGWLQAQHVPVAGVGLIRDGKIRVVKVFGELQPGNAAPFNTIFNVASITKTIFVTLTMKLVANGQWNLDEPLDKYWIDPDIAADPRYHKLTTRLVLSHQTGFPNWRWMHKDGKLSFEFDPGTRYQYSGEGMEYLRRAIEKKLHISFEKLADSLLFQPLGMHDTRLTWDENVVSRFATGYNKEGKPYENTRNSAASAADDMLTTVEDYCKFAAALLNGEILPPAVFAQMTTLQRTVKPGKGFGLGWELYDAPGQHQLLGHGGADHGVHAQVLLVPATKDALIIFTDVDDGWKIYEPLVDHYLGEDGRRVIAVEMAPEK